MLKIDSYDIVFQEIPQETTLALNLTCCPHRCQGCHSPHLWTDSGKELTEELLDCIIDKYREAITCVCFMGGDADVEQVLKFAAKIKDAGLKSAWYSGNSEPPYPFDSDFWEKGILNFMKLGPWISNLGGLKDPTTNQRFYVYTPSGWSDNTYLFRKTYQP